jgi:serine protease AprX
MRRVLLGCAVVLSLAIAPLVPASARPGSHGRGPERQMLTDRDGDRLDDVLERRLRTAEAGKRISVIVATDGSLNLTQAHRAVGAFGVSRRLAIIDGFSARMTVQQVSALSRQPGVLRIDLNGVVHVTMDAARADYGVEAARSQLGLTGAGVNVCILDTGADPNHEQLDSKAIVWRDYVNGRTTPYDDQGHGTHVASIAVGDGTGGGSAARYGGVAPGAGLWAGKVLDAAGSGSTENIVAAIGWCAADPAVDVISMSLGSEYPSDGTDTLSMAANNAVAAGKVVTGAAGNYGDAPNMITAPGAAPDVIAVGAASSWSAAPNAPNHSDGISLAVFSSRGGSNFQGDQKPDIVAPGVNVMAASANTSSGYILHSGTSMATPFAAGSVALALQASPQWTPAQVATALGLTAEDFGPAGKDAEWGAGLIDVLALSAQAAGQTGENPFPSHVHRSVTVPDAGEWTYSFDVASEDLDVPIAATVVLMAGSGCTLFFPLFGCLDEWSPDLDVKLFDPNGTLLDISQCAFVATSGDPHVDTCKTGRQETVHSMPTVAGTYRITVYAFAGGPGAPISFDLSTGPIAGGPPPPPPPPPPSTTIHVGDLDRDSSWLTSTTWRARATIRVHDGDELAVAGVVVTGRWGANGSVTCTTNLNGNCSVTRDLKKAKASIVFRVLGLLKSSYTYVAADNHDELDEDGSNGTTITVNRP